MKVRRGILDHLHIDSVYCLMTAKHVRLLYEVFKILDIHDREELNDIQFLEFMRHVTDLGKRDIYKVFDMLDVDGSGKIDFDEFYMLTCILVALKDNQVKRFIHCHSRSVFGLLDADANKSISAKEFQQFGFLFNYTGLAVRKIFHDFDVTGDQELEYNEFRMFAMACIDAQKEIEETKKKNLAEKIRKAQQGSWWLRLQVALGIIPVMKEVDDVSVSNMENEPELEVLLDEAKKSHDPWESLVNLYTSTSNQSTEVVPKTREEKRCLLQ